MTYFHSSATQKPDGPDHPANGVRGPPACIATTEVVARRGRCRTKAEPPWPGALPDPRRDHLQSRGYPRSCGLTARARTGAGTEFAALRVRLGHSEDRSA
jgi:hypothetical protein